MNQILPIEAKAFRFAPALGGQPASTFWKVWSEGVEVYLASRSQAGDQHISVHQSGAIHFRLGTKQKQDLAPLMRLASGHWQHAVELRFLLSKGALLPLDQAKSLKKKKAHIIPVPEGHVLHVNLLIGDAQQHGEVAHPSDVFPGASLLWRSRLRDGRVAALIGRQIAQSEENMKAVRHIREELKPTVTFTSSRPGGRHIEIHHMHWSAHGGNVILVVPMGEEAFRADDEPVPPEDIDREREFAVAAKQSDQNILAPDGRPVVAMRLEEFSSRLTITKGRPIETALGQVQFELIGENLALGSPFIAQPVKLPHALTVGGALPREWAYSVTGRFDGAHMAVELRQLSTGLQNRYLEKAVEGLVDNEELTLLVPRVTMRCTLTLQEPRLSSTLIGRVRLRDRR